MPIDASLYSQFAPRVQSPMDVQNALGQNATNQLALQHGRIDVQNALQAQTEAAGVREAAKSFGNDPQANYQSLLQVSPSAAQAYLKSALEARSAQSTIDLNASKGKEQDALAATHGLDATIKKHDFAVQQLGSVNTPQDAIAWASKQRADGAFTDQDLLQHTSDILKAAQNPQAFQQWKQTTLQSGVSAVEQMKMKQQAEIAANVQKGENLRNAATNATSRANNSATIANDYKVAGLDQQGNFQGGSGAMDGLIDGIGQGKIPEATALGRVPPGIKAQVMQAVMQKYPDYDPTALATKGAANKAFTSGKEAGMLRSIGTATKHLDMVGGMVDALDNGNIQIFNRLGQAYAQQTGGTAPTNFDAAKEIVGQEVVKSIVANGGGVKEREEAAAALDKAKSPAQLRGVIQTYKTIMGAQRESLLQQRDAAGLPRSTLPNYDEQPSAPAGLPQGWKIEKVK